MMIETSKFEICWIGLKYNILSNTKQCEILYLWFFDSQCCSF